MHVSRWVLDPTVDATVRVEIPAHPICEIMSEKAGERSVKR
jgi:hypothetical protein